MRNLQNPNWTNAELLISFLPPYGPMVAYCSSLSRGAAFEEVVIAADVTGKRLRLLITDSKYNHTSYSTELIYTIVD